MSAVALRLAPAEIQSLVTLLEETIKSQGEKIAELTTEIAALKAALDDERCVTLVCSVCGKRGTATDSDWLVEYDGYSADGRTVRCGECAKAVPARETEEQQP